MTQNTIGTDGSEDDAAFVERITDARTTVFSDGITSQSYFDRLIALARLGARRAPDANVPRDGRREGMLRAAEIADRAGNFWLVESDKEQPESAEWRYKKGMRAGAYDAAAAIRAEADAIAPQPNLYCTRPEQGCYYNPHPDCPHCSTIPAGAGGVMEAAQRLVDKLKLIHNNDEYKGVWVLCANHGAPYCGPSYQYEMEALRAALAAQSPVR